MAVRRDSVYEIDGVEGEYNKREDTSQPCEGVSSLILDFLKTSHNIPRRRYIIARNQLLSLYRRMRLHPENKPLCEGYIDQIRQIIQLERGTKK
jgi:hypothetical protein